VAIGEATHFSFDVLAKKAGSVRLEYGVYFVKASGEGARKVFFIQERTFAEGETAYIKRKQSFQQRTTRKHYAGAHRLTIIVNGIESAETSIDVLAEQS
jgi:hypothetical protein